MKVRIHKYVLYTRVLVLMYIYTNLVYAQTSHCVHTHITPLAEFTFLTEPFPTEAKADHHARYEVCWPDGAMVTYCAKGTLAMLSKNAVCWNAP